MPQSPWEDLDAVLAALPRRPWSGTAWRFHGCRYDATSVGGALRISGRYHRGLDFFPGPETWPALYLALAPHIAIAERLRHTSPETFTKISTQCLSELRIDLRAVVDCCADPERLTPAFPGLALADLCSIELGDHVGHLLEPVDGVPPHELEQWVSFSDVHDLNPGHEA